MPSTTLHQPHHTPAAPEAIGPYVQARLLDSGGLRWLFSSGQVGIDPRTGELAGETTEMQMRQVLDAIRHDRGDFRHDVHGLLTVLPFLPAISFSLPRATSASSYCKSRSNPDITGLPTGRTVSGRLKPGRTGQQEGGPSTMLGPPWRETKSVGCRWPLAAAPSSRRP